MPPGSEIDARLEQLADSYLAIPRPVRQAAATVQTLCLQLRPAAALRLVGLAGQILADQQRGEDIR